MREHLIRLAQPQVEPLHLTAAKLNMRVETSDEDSLISVYIAAARMDAEIATRRSFVSQRWTLLLDEFPRPGLNIGSANWYGPQWGVNPGPMTVLSPDGFTGYEIFLSNPPTISVDSITYTDTDGNPQTLDPSQYRVVLSEKASITPAYNTVWPETREQKACVAVNFTAGFAAPITADATANTITPSGWAALNVNDPVCLSNSGGAVPAPLVAGTTYFVQSIPSAGVYKLAATPSGSAIDLIDAGTGLSFIGAVPEAILQWMLVRVATIYANREEVAILPRGKVELLPYVDNLLTPYRVLEY